MFNIWERDGEKVGEDRGRSLVVMIVLVNFLGVVEIEWFFRVIVGGSGWLGFFFFVLINY